MNQTNDPFSQAVKSAVDAGRKIEAIKIYRAETGVGLKEAKDAVDFLALQRKGSPTTNNADMSEPGSGAGSLVKLLVFVVALVLLYKYFVAN